MKQKIEFMTRIYDSSMLETIDTIMTTKKYKNRNELINECVKIALPIILRRDFDIKGKTSTTPPASVATIGDESKKLLFMLDEIFIKTAIIEKLMSALYNIAYYKAQGMIVDKDLFESRVLEALPDELEEFQQALLDIYRGKGEKNA